jgi:hypothetical protein
MEVAREAESIISELILAHTREDVDYVTSVMMEGHRLRVMEGDTAGPILNYLPTGEMVNTILGVKGMNDKTLYMHNSEESYEMISQERLHKCMNILQDTAVEPGEYMNIGVVDATYKVGAAVRIIDNNTYHSGNGDLKSRSGTVVMCCSDKNNRSHCVAVYMLLDKLKAHVLLMVVKGMPKSIYLCREEEQHARPRNGWHIRVYPHREHWKNNTQT